MLIAVEGPNGVGKTTVAALLADRLAEVGGVGVHLTSEPTRTPLGQLIRRHEEALVGRALALALAADRAAHVEHDIIPRLDDGLHVVTDRYVQSSLVLQRLDGLELQEIWSYNAFVVIPAVTFYLEEDPDVIRERLSGRPALSRLENAGGPGREIRLYREAAQFLRHHDWQQHTINCHGMTPEQVAATILKLLVPVTA